MHDSGEKVLALGLGEWDALREVSGDVELAGSVGRLVISSVSSILSVPYEPS